MKKLLIASITVLIFIFGCSKKESIPGVVGKPLHLANIIESSDDTAGCTFKWNFASKPHESNMDVLSFQPNSRSFSIYYVPDIEGKYTLQCSIIDSSGNVKSKKVFICEVIEDTTQTEEITEMEITHQMKIEDTLTPTVKKTVAKTTYTTKRSIPTRTRRPKVIRGKNILKIPGKYTIQISSWKSYEGAERAIAKLSSLGLDAYIQKAHFDETGETWYRIRTGSFDSCNEAKVTMNTLKKKLPREHLWVDNMREDQQ